MVPSFPLRYGASPARMWANLPASILPPETMHTTVAARTRPLIAAATGLPAPARAGPDPRPHRTASAQDLTTERPAHRQHRRIAHWMDKQALNARVRAVQEDLPPDIKRHCDRPCTQAFDGCQLGARRVVGHNHRAGDAQPTGVPGDALRHVAGAGRVDAPGQLIRWCGRDSVAGPTQLER